MTIAAKHRLELVKGTERYVFIFNDENMAHTRRQLGRFASNPELSFTWYDAAWIEQKMRGIERHSKP